MQKIAALTGALVGLLTGIILVVVFFLADALFALSIVPFNLFDWIARTLPGPLITFGIDTMVDTLTALGFNVANTAKTSENIMALGMLVAPLTVAGGLFFVVMKRLTWRLPDHAAGALLGFILGAPLAFISFSITSSTGRAGLIAGAWTLVTLVLWGVGVERAFRRLERTAEGDETVPLPVEEGRVPLAPAQQERRRFLLQLGGATAAITVVGAGVNLGKRTLTNPTQSVTQGDSNMDGMIPEEVIAVLPNADDPVEPAPGTRPEYTPLDLHYNVDINSRPIMIDGHTWRLEISGLVDTPLELSIEQLRRDFTSVDQYITLSCISNRVGGSLISTTKWTGIPLSEILAEAGLQDGASHLFINSRDGFYETYDLRLMEEDQRVMLVYAWNDEPLRHKHGFPLRIWIPDRYGMKQPKWIDSIEVIDGSRPGYWVERGWDAVARVKTTSVIDTVGMSHLSDGVQVVPIGGIAYSGAKGISKVQVRIDQSDWQDVQIRRPLSDTTWVIWRFDWPFEAGEHLFEVRTFEQDGTPQTDTVAGSRPSGATGIHSVRSALG